MSVGVVRWAVLKSLWLLCMAAAALAGGVATYTWAAFALFIVSTALVLLFGHSLGSHRKLIHNSFQCSRWLEHARVYLGVQAGWCGPLGVLRQHELRDVAKHLPRCHDYLRHGRGAGGTRDGRFRSIFGVEKRCTSCTSLSRTFARRRAPVCNSDG